MTNAAGLVRRDQGRAARVARRPARWPRSSCPPAEADQGGLALRAPDGRTQAAAGAGATRSTIGPLDQCGVWSDRPAVGRGRRRRRPSRRSRSLELACNLAEPPRERPPAAPRARAERRRWPAGFGGRPIWYYLIAAAWLLAGLEWFLYQRRWIELMMPQTSWFPFELTRPGWLLGPGRPAGPRLLLLPQPGRLRPLAAGSSRSACRAADRRPAGPGAGGPDPAAADPRAVRRLRRRPEPERRRRGRKAADDFVDQAAAHGRAEPVRRARRSPPSRASIRAGTAPATARPRRASRRARRQGDRPRRGDRGGRRGDPAVLRPADRRCSPTATRPPATPSRPRSRARECRVSTVPLPTRTDPEVQVSAVNVPAQVQQGEPFNVEVVDRLATTTTKGQHRGLPRRHQGRRPAR